MGLSSNDTNRHDVQSRKRERSLSPRSPSRDKSSLNTDACVPSKKTSSGAVEQVMNIYGKTGGAYIPPARLRQMQASITDKSSDAYQRIAWEALKKSIHGLINKVNVSNISDVVRQLLTENVVRGRGLLVRSLMTAQLTSPTFTHVFAALVAVVNSKFPQVGELVLKRLVNEFRKAFRRNQKDRCLAVSRFLAHLVNQNVVHELIVLQLLTLLLEQTTDDSVEVAVSVLKECGAMLTRLVPKGVHGIFEHLRRILNEGQCDKRISYMLEVMFQIRRDGWRDHPIVLPELDLIPESDQITHTIELLDQVDPEDHLNVFRLDPNYLENEDKYAKIKASFFESDDEDDGDGSSGSGDDDNESGDGDSDAGGERAQGAVAASSTTEGDQSQTIIDQTATNLVQLRRTIYLMLQSSLSADEAGHRLLQLKIRPGEEYEVASMVLDCCAQTRSYETRYGRLAQRLCRVLLTFGAGSGGGGSKPLASEEVGPGSRYRSSQSTSRTAAKTDNASTESAAVDAGPPRSYVAEFEKIFSEQYNIIHRLETAKLRNVALFFAHLLYTDSLSWGVMECIKLNERDTTSSGRIFLKHMLLELCSFMGLAKLQARLRDETLQSYFVGLLPRDNPKDTRFAINFLTTIGLGGLTLDLRDHLKASRDAALSKQEMEAIDADGNDSGDNDDDANVHSSSSSTSSNNDSEPSPSKLERKSFKKHQSKRKHKHNHDSTAVETSTIKDRKSQTSKQQKSREEKREKHARGEKRHISDEEVSIVRSKKKRSCDERKHTEKDLHDSQHRDRRRRRADGSPFS